MCSRVRCAKPSSPGFKLCDDHRNLYRVQANTRRKRLVSNGVCTKCMEPCEGSRCSQCKLIHNLNNRTRRHIARDEVITVYGGHKCVCCGETGKRFLTIDHINNDGNKHRKDLGSPDSEVLYRWLKKHNYPPGFQVLCWNCNIGKMLNGGVCPHVDGKTTNTV